MAVGGPEHEVYAATDAVLARGERPKVERGRGSPARVGGLLDQWWARLTERLNGEPACRHYRVGWHRGLRRCGSRPFAWPSASLNRRWPSSAERERVAAIEDQARKDAAQFRQLAAEAAAGRQWVELRLVDLEQLLSQRQTQIEDLQL